MSLIAELKRRNVFRVGAAYLALGWIVTQVTATVTPAFNLPPSALSLVAWAGVIGFPFVVLFAWIYELTPEGLKRESEVDRSASITPITGRRLDYVIIGLMVVAIGMFAVREFLPDSNGQAAATATVTEADRLVTPIPGPTAATLPPAALPASAAAPDPKSIAVLPFVNMSEDASNEFFSDGIAEELLNLLARIPELRVTSRSSAFAFKGEKFDIAQVAAKLHVAHILEGSVRKVGNRVRITAQLVDTRSDTHLWSQTYDRTLDDIFAVQDEIAGAVVEQLKIKLLGAAPTVRKTDPKAYALMLQARQLTEQRNSESVQRSIELLEQALVIDPGYASAWTGLGQSYLMHANNGAMPVDEALRLAHEAVNKALAIDAGFAPAYAALGLMAMAYEGDVAGAAQHIEKALQLDPANIESLRAAGSLAVNIARPALALQVQEYVVARDPVNALGHDRLGDVFLHSGRYDEAISAFETALSLGPARIITNYRLGMALLLRGNTDAALARIEREPDESWRLFGLAMVYHTLGRHAESDTALAQLIAKYEKDSAYNIAYVLAWRGDADRAFEWLHKAVAYKDGGLIDIAVNPLFKPIHDDPRWLPFLRTVGRAPEQLAAIEFDVKLPT